MYADCPECIGASCKGELLCCVQRACLKFGVPPLTCCESFVDKEVCCQIGLCCCAIGVKCPSTCIKHQGQCCCIVENVAIPCDSEIPMYRDGVRRWGLRPIGATVARQIPVLKVTRSNRVSVTEVWAVLRRWYTHRSKDAPRSRRAKVLACCVATVIFGPKASLFAGAAAVVTWSRHRAARVEAALGGEPSPAPTPAPVAEEPAGERR